MKNDIIESNENQMKIFLRNGILKRYKRIICNNQLKHRVTLLYIHHILNYYMKYKLTTIFINIVILKIILLKNTSHKSSNERYNRYFYELTFIFTSGKIFLCNYK
jgi:hypothetical protein